MRMARIEKIRYPYTLPDGSIVQTYDKHVFTAQIPKRIHFWDYLDSKLRKKYRKHRSGRILIRVQIYILIIDLEKK